MENQNLLDVSKGLHSDYSPIAQPTGTYSYLLNAIRLASGAIQNEMGTIEVATINKKILNGIVLDRDIILCLYPSEIGVLNEREEYKIITNREDLNFQPDLFIDLAAKKSFNSHRILFTVDGFNPDRRIDLDDIEQLTSLSFKDDTRIQVNPTIPEINVLSVVDGGTLPTGVYQATVRLLTKSTNAAPFGFVSPLIPIIDETSNIDYEKQDGAIPQSQSPKAINFRISNIDTQYEYIQVAIITYTGTANVSTANIVATLPIDGRSEINFTYSSISQNKEAIDLQAISVKPVYYDHSKAIEQKDGILVRSNLTATQESFNFQKIANQVSIKYFIEEIPWQPGYKDALIAALKRSYQRGEVYSLGFTPEFTTSYNTTAYHIPANGNSPFADTSSRELGTYKSLEEYPLDRDYPLGNVLHHRMPTVQQEPLIIMKGGMPYLRIIGLEVDFSQAIALIPAETMKNLKGFSLVRQTRQDNNKSIIAQGIANPHISTGNYTYLSPFPKVAYPGTSFLSTGTPIGNKIGFMSPETVVYNDLPIGQLELQTLCELRGTQKIVHDLRTSDNDNGEIANTQVFLDYNQMYPLTQTYSDISIVSNSPQYIPSSPGDIVGPDTSNITIMGTSDIVNNFKNNGYLFLKLDSNLPIKQDLYDGKPEFFYNYRVDRTDDIYLNGVLRGDVENERKGNTTRYLYNIVRVLDRQYGAIYDAKYIVCGTYHLIDNPVDQTFRCFGGDTFIGKFGVVNQSGTTNAYDEIDFRVLSYFFCESEINVDFRHYAQPVGSEGQQGFIPGTTPYYPKLSILYNDPEDKSLTPGILNLSWTLGHGRGYNKQYSFESSLITLYPKSLQEELVTDFPNRSIYSEQSIEGEQLDAYRIFLPNNYHDIPKDRGEIVDTFVHNNRFYIHTTGALFVSSFNDKVMTTTTVSDVYLGNGGVFNRPSEPVYTVNGGYAGTQGHWGLSTPSGYFFIDARQKKVFLLGNQLQDLSGQGLDLFFQLIQETDSFHLVYDYEWDRLLLTSSKGWTLSYQSDLKSWSSYHSYIPYFMISRGQEVYFGFDLGIHKMNVGGYGQYFGSYSPLILEYVFNTQASDTKSFDNSVIHCSSFLGDVFAPYTTFTNLKVYNETKDTSNLMIRVPETYAEELVFPSVEEVFAKKKNQEFRVAVGPDLLINSQLPGNYATSKSFRPRMTGKWAKFQWTFNKPDYKFVLHTIETKVRLVAR
jgi:hypothetical protein